MSVHPFIGMNLLDFLNKQQKNTPREDLYKYIDQVFRACESLDGSAHSDIKPENFLIDERAKKLYLIDLGFIRHKEEKGLHTRGSPEWAAPEIWRRQQPELNKLDVWALGALIHCMLTNTYFSWQNIDSIPSIQRAIRKMKQSDVDAEIDKAKLSAPEKLLIKKMMVINPQDRLSVAQAAELFRKDILKLQME